MKSLTRPQLDRLLTVTRKHSEQDYLMLAVIFNHGLRISEVVGGWATVKGVKVWNEGLTRANIVSGHLVIQRLKRSRKTVQPLLPSERQGLEQLAGETEDRLFPMSRMTAWRRMQAYCAEAGVPLFLAHPHALKHSTGRLAYQGGMGIPELQAYLGHVSGSSTMVYLQADETEAAAAFAAAVSGTISA